MYILSVFELDNYKKRKNCFKALYIEKQRDIARKVYNECFVVKKKPQGKKRINSCIWRSFLDIKMLKLMNNTLNIETEHLTKCVSKTRKSKFFVKVGFIPMYYDCPVF